MADTPSSFPKFNSLPPEIRNLIWEAALPGPRLIHIEASYRAFYSCYRVRSDVAVDALNVDGFPAFFDHDYGYRADDLREMQDDPHFTTRAPPPVLLYVCRESFEVASKHHPRVFGTAYSPPKVSFNFMTDTLYLDWDLPWFGGVFQPKDFSWVELAKVRYLTIECNESCARNFNFDSKEEFLAMVLSYFPNLEKLTISRTDAFLNQSNTGDLVLMNLLSEKALVYHRPENDDDDDQLFCWFVYFYETGEGLFDSKKLERCRKEHMAKKGNGRETRELPPLPKIDCQIVTTPAIKERLQQRIQHLEAVNEAERKRRERKLELRKTRHHAGEGRYNVRSMIHH
jgi:hypothetical protein